MTLLGAVLDVAYPALIALAIMNIADKLIPRKDIIAYTQWAFWGIFGSAIGLKILG